MRLITEFRIFADHYQFFVYSAEADPCPESFYSGSDDCHSKLGSYQQGYITNGTTICFCTNAHLNDHWIEVYISEERPDFNQAERVIALPLQVDSGKVSITNLIYLNRPIHEIAISPGRWIVYLLAFNLGSDQYWDRRVKRPERSLESERLSDEQLRVNWDFERYRIIFVPNFPTAIGVLRDTSTNSGN